LCVEGALAQLRGRGAGVPPTSAQLVGDRALPFTCSWFPPAMS